MKKLFLLFYSVFCLLPSAFSQITQQNVDKDWSGTATGTNSYSVTISKITSTVPYNFQTIQVYHATTNTGAASLKVTGATGVVYAAIGITLNGAVLTGGEIPAGITSTYKYDAASAKWQLQKAPRYIVQTGSANGSGNLTAASMEVNWVNVSDTTQIFNLILFNTSAYNDITLAPISGKTVKVLGTGNIKLVDAVSSVTLNGTLREWISVRWDATSSKYIQTGGKGIGGVITPGWNLTGNSGTTAGTNFIGNTDSIDLVFKTNNIERMRVLANGGNVGIGTGTVTPTARLHLAATYTTNANFIQKNYNGNNIDVFNLRGDKFVGFGVESPQIYDFGEGGEFVVKLGRLHAEFVDNTTGKGLLIRSYNEPYEATEWTAIGGSYAYRDRGILLNDTGSVVIGGIWNNSLPAGIKIGFDMNVGQTNKQEQFAIVSQDTLLNSGIRQTYYMPTNATSLGNFLIAEFNILKADVNNQGNKRRTYFQWKNFDYASSTMLERMRIDSSGYVGINSSTPTTTLDINGGLTIEPLATQTLTAASTTVTVGNESYIKVTSDDATPANRLLVLPQSTSAGQILIIEFVGATNALRITDDAAQGTGGNMRLAGDMDMNQYDTITLISNGTDWIETSRSVN